MHLPDYLSTLHDDTPTRRKTRTELLVAAYQLIAREGLFNSTIVDLAKDTGLARRTLYNYYPSIQELCADLHPAVLRYWLDVSLEGENAQPDSPEATLERLHQTLLSDTELLRYIVKMDFYLQAHPEFISPELQLSRYLQQSLPWEATLALRLQHLPEEERQERIHWAIEGFLAYLERVSFRLQAYQREHGDFPSAAELLSQTLHKLFEEPK